MFQALSSCSASGWFGNCGMPGVYAGVLLSYLALVMASNAAFAGSTATWVTASISASV